MSADASSASSSVRAGLGLLRRTSGLAPGARRRTPGLRREEVAQEAGVGVTWYTWLEQGRPIRASTQVIDSIARALRLDEAEREHLYHLSDTPLRVVPAATPAVSPAVLEVVRSLDPMPAALVNSRWDLLATNEAFHHLFAHWHDKPCQMRNMIWCTFTEFDVRCALPQLRRGGAEAGRAAAGRLCQPPG